ncbi:MAG TPA: hypothetical protein VLM91_22400 [Candidatus Methylomirabilis sp.]|nr:hypothetical protein [Candidatus Methylomirabilis sp.]
MNFAGSSTPNDLEAGIRTHPEDVLALRRARHGPAMTLEDYLNFLAQLEEPPVAVLWARRGPRGDIPFEL